MNNNILSLEQATFADFDDYLRLKSEDSNIYWSGFNSPPDHDKLLEHYLAALSSSSRKIYFLKESRVVLGYLYMDYLSDKRTVELAYGISEYQAGRGLAKVMLTLGLDMLSDDINKQIAWIAEMNIASIKTVEALGFGNTEDIEYRTLKQFVEKVKFVKFIRMNKKLLKD